MEILAIDSYVVEPVILYIHGHDRQSDLLRRRDDFKNKFRTLILPAIIVHAVTFRKVIRKQSGTPYETNCIGCGPDFGSNKGQSEKPTDRKSFLKRGSLRRGFHFGSDWRKTILGSRSLRPLSNHANVCSRSSSPAYTSATLYGETQRSFDCSNIFASSVRAPSRFPDLARAYPRNENDRE